MAKKKTVKNAKAAAKAVASSNANGNIESDDYKTGSDGGSNGYHSPNNNNDTSSSGGIPLFWKCLAVLVAYIAINREKLWPWGIACEIPNNERSNYASIDETNDSLMSKHGKLTKIYERKQKGATNSEPLMKGPETILFSNDGTLIALTEEGKLISLTDFVEEESANTTKILTAKSTLVADLGVGRPLGGKFHPKENTVYVADAHLGLLRLKLDGNDANGNNRKKIRKRNQPSSATNADTEGPTTKNKVELIASRVYDNDEWTQIKYCNDVVIGPKTGIVYFTDSTEIAPDRVGTRTWDTMYGAKTDLLRGKRTGRLLQYDPSTDAVTVLARDLFFPNGISISKDETAVFFAETFALTLMKYNLKDRSLTTVVDGKDHTGYTDGLDCAWNGITAKSSLCYAAMPSAVVPLMKLAWKIPHPFDIVFRSLLMALPKKLAPPVKPYGGIIEVDAFGTGDGGGKMTRLIQDPTGADVGMINGVTVYDNKLYLGSLYNDYITVYDLE